ncbi:MAG: carbohydrate ABC transporter permease [Actinomycetota bacterium]
MTISAKVRRPPAISPTSKRRPLRGGLMALGLALLGTFAVFPFIWMAFTSVRPQEDLFQSDNPWTISRFTMEHYRFLLLETEYLRWIANSAIVATVATMIALVIGTFAAYALGRLNFRGAGAVALVVFATYLVPPVLLFIPLNTVVRQLRLTNTLWALIVVYLTFLVPFIAWLLSSYFAGLPKELSEAARIDGASYLQTMLLVDMPLILPGVVSVFFFAFTLAWQEFLYAFTFLRSSDKYPVSVGVVNELSVGDVQFWGELMAGALLGSIPIVVLFAFLMDFYVEGLTAGAVKG